MCIIDNKAIASMEEMMDRIQEAGYTIRFVPMVEVPMDQNVFELKSVEEFYQILNNRIIRPDPFS